ncbi:hypothetical protein JHK82_048290 [Glycine max]|nr:hypothetical protein JHK82_048290 [Glycine max]
MMVTWDDSESEKSNSFDNEKANICLMVDTYDKVEVINRGSMCVESKVGQKA